MGLFEIIAGILLMFSCVAIIGIVLSQEPKGEGLSSVFTGTQITSGDRVKSKEVRQIRMTRIAAVCLFVLTLAVNIASLFATKG